MAHRVNRIFGQESAAGLSARGAPAGVIRPRFVLLFALFAALLLFSWISPSWAASYNVANGDVLIQPSAGKIKVTVGLTQNPPIPADEKIVLFSGSKTTVANTITVDGVNVKITLDNVKIDANSNSAFEIRGGAAVELTLSGDNTLKSGLGRAGLEVEYGNTLTIHGTNGDTGILTAFGGNGGAGIGGGTKSGKDSGTIIVAGGTVNAASRGTGGAGIGGGFGKGGGSITITGGSVTADGGIGGAGLGGGGSNNNNDGKVVIKGGEVSASGGGYGSAGIGGGQGGNGGSVAISGGRVTATGGTAGAGIGGGINGNGGSIAISGGRVSAAGVDSGAGIGGGRDGNGGNITISGGTVSSLGAGGGMDIGPGLSGNGNGTVTITGGTVRPLSGAAKISPLPTNGTGGIVYLNTLTVGSLPLINTLVTSCSVDDGAEGYGVNDVYTDAHGKLYFWLPSKTGGSIMLSADQNNYSETFTREDNDSTEVLVTLTSASTSTEPGTKPEPGTDTGTHPEPGTEPGTKPEPGTDTGTHPEPGTEPGTKPEPGTDTGTHPEPGTEPGTKPEPGTDTGTHPGSGTEPGTKPEPGADTGTHPGPGTEPGTKPEPGTDTGTHPGPGTEPGTKPEPGTGTGTHPEPGTEPGTKPEPGTDTGTHPGAGTEPGGEPELVSVSRVTLVSHNLTLAAGQTHILRAAVTPGDATNQKLTWGSDQPKIASVDDDGLVRALAIGQTKITVRTEDGGHEDACTVTVTKAAITIDFSGLELEDGVLPLAPGQSVDVTINAAPSGASFTATGLPEGLTLSQDGNLTGAVNMPGCWRVTVTATLPDGTTAEKSFIINVNEEHSTGNCGGCQTGADGISAILAFLAVVLAAKGGGRRGKLRA